MGLGQQRPLALQGFDDVALDLALTNVGVDPSEAALELGGLALKLTALRLPIVAFVLEHLQARCRGGVGSFGQGGSQVVVVDTELVELGEHLLWRPLSKPPVALLPLAKLVGVSVSISSSLFELLSTDAKLVLEFLFDGGAALLDATVEVGAHLFEVLRVVLEAPLVLGEVALLGLETLFVFSERSLMLDPFGVERRSVAGQLGSRDTALLVECGTM